MNGRAVVLAAVVLAFLAGLAVSRRPDAPAIAAHPMTRVDVAYDNTGDSMHFSPGPIMFLSTGPDDSVPVYVVRRFESGKHRGESYRDDAQATPATLAAAKMDSVFADTVISFPYALDCPNYHYMMVGALPGRGVRESMPPALLREYFQSPYSAISSGDSVGTLLARRFCTY